MSNYSKLLVVTTVLCVFSACSSGTLYAQTPNPTPTEIATDATAETETRSPELTPAADDTGTTGTDSTPPPVKIDNAEVPYIGKVTGNRVYIRSGPAQVYYDVGQLRQGQLVVVRDERRGVSNWAKIEPTVQCFSWISKQYVELVGMASIPEESKPPTSTEPSKATGNTATESETAPAAGSESNRTEPTTTTDSTATTGIVPAAPKTEEIKSFTPTATPEKPTVPGPPAPLASLIGKKMILGRVTGNYVRVRAGSVKVPPANANQVQMRLNKGAEVQIIGEKDDYYKIISPVGSSFWVSLDYIERVGPATPEFVEKMLKIRRVSVPGGFKVETVADKDRQEYQKLGELLNIERSKPISQQDFTKIRTRLTKLTQEAKSPSFKAMAQSLERQLVRCEMGVNLWKMSKRQDDRLEATLKKIDEELELLVAVNSPPNKGIEDIVVKGRLGKSAVFTTPNKNQRFLVLDANERIIYYAVTGKEGLDLSQWVDKQVSLSGQPEYDAFSKIRILKVTSLVELPPEK